jgi:hypothetical protein
VLFILTGCEKDEPITFSPDVMNFAPRVTAGADYYIVLPTDTAILDGTAKDALNDIVQQKWEKISGPAGYLIERPDSLQTVVRNLVRGTYLFELTVTDRGGLTGRDTVKVDVMEPINLAGYELFFDDQGWIFPWYASIEVKNIILYSPPRNIFIQRDFDSTWQPVRYLSDNLGNRYEYFIQTSRHGLYNYGSLYIVYYGNNTGDTPRIKIQF